MDPLLDELSRTDPEDRDVLRQTAGRIRELLKQVPIPDTVAESVLAAWRTLGEDGRYAVRSSATMEDLPSASFAGQQDSFLNIRGEQSLLEHLRKCWASLFTDRAASYRAKNGLDHRRAAMAVIVQRMVNPDVSGILFTADPLSGHRETVSIDAAFGLGEAIVSGLVTADLYRVRHGRITDRQVNRKKLAIFARPDGGTVRKELPEPRQTEPALTDGQILRLAEIGKRIEHRFGTPQDIEFCIENGNLFIVQSRPITTLHPLPDIPAKPLRILYSLGHVQMMTEAVKPLGISVLRHMPPVGKKAPFSESMLLVPAGGRFYVDATPALRHPVVGKILPRVLAIVDEQISRALAEAVKRPEFRKTPRGKGVGTGFLRMVLFLVRGVAKTWRSRPEEAIHRMEDLIRRKRQEVSAALAGKSGPERIREIQRQLDTLAPDMLKTAAPLIYTGLMAGAALRKMLGDERMSVLSRSLPHNITSEMGLAIGDLADLARRHPAVLEQLTRTQDAAFFEELERVEGGPEFAEAFRGFLKKYGMRCPGEINVTAPRWRERPAMLVPSILSHIRSVEPGEHRRRFAQGAREAEELARQLTLHVPRLKARLLARLISLYRHLAGLREHPKYLLVSVLDECKKAIMEEARLLTDKGVLAHPEEIGWFSLEEIIRLAEGTFEGDIRNIIAEREEEHRRNQSLTPPRVMTSEGEIISGSVQKPVREGLLIGTAASAGVAEGRARVVFRPEEAGWRKGKSWWHPTPIRDGRRSFSRRKRWSPKPAA